MFAERRMQEGRRTHASVRVKPGQSQDSSSAKMGSTPRHLRDHTNGNEKVSSFACLHKCILEASCLTRVLSVAFADGRT